MCGTLECSIMKIMKTIIEKIDKNQKNTDIIREAGRILKEGGLVAFPTETVYGLGADALNEDAAKKIYAAKGRPSDNPLIIHITNMKALDKIVSEVPEKAVKVAEGGRPCHSVHHYAFRQCAGFQRFCHSPFP